MANYNYNNKLEAFQYNSKSVVVVVYDASGNLKDLTNYDAYFYAQKFPIRAGSTLDVSISASAVDASGTALFDLTKNDLDLAVGDYVYEIIIDDGSTNRISVVQDKITLKDSIVK